MGGLQPLVATTSSTPRSLLSSYKPKSPSLLSNPTLPTWNFSPFLRRRETRRLSLNFMPIRSQASNVGAESSSYDGSEDNDTTNKYSTVPSTESSSQIEKRPSQIPYPLSIAAVLAMCAVLYSLIMFVKGGPSSILAAIAKSGFTAAFTLIFVSEIGDKTFFIAALLAMQYEKGLVLLGSMGALGLMTILSVIIGRIFQSVPAQFQTTLPIGEYAAVTLLLFFGLKSIKDAWYLPSKEVDSEKKNGPELDEYVEAEELVKEKVSKRLSSPLEILWKSFTLVFFAVSILHPFTCACSLCINLAATLRRCLVWRKIYSVENQFQVEWGDRSMLATIALGAAQSPWGVATGAILGHLVATSVAILGGAFLANYISEKLVGYLGGGLFLIFAIATFFGFF